MATYSGPLQRSFLVGLSRAMGNPAAYNRTLTSNASKGSSFPSWTWAAHKAAYPTAMNDIMVSHFDLELSEDIVVQIEHTLDAMLVFMIFGVHIVTRLSTPAWSGWPSSSTSQTLSFWGGKLFQSY
jgi:hypothetical protein